MIPAGLLSGAVGGGTPSAAFESEANAKSASNLYSVNQPSFGNAGGSPLDIGGGIKFPKLKNETLIIAGIILIAMVVIWRKT